MITLKHDKYWRVSSSVVCVCVCMCVCMCVCVSAHTHTALDATVHQRCSRSEYYWSMEICYDRNRTILHSRFEINVEQTLQQLVGQQCETKLGR